MKRLLTQQLGPYVEVVPNATDGWIPPEGNRVFTPQQDIVVVAIDMSGHLANYESDLAIAGADTVEFVQQITQSSAVDVPGLLAQMDIAVGTSLQGAIQNSGPTFPSGQNKYVAFPDSVGLTVQENTDIGVWVYRRNITGNDVTLKGLIIVHYYISGSKNI